MKKRLLSILLCSSIIMSLVPKAAFATTTTDYFDASNWMYQGNDTDYAVDVFYLYPTVIDDANQPDVAKMNDKAKWIAGKAFQKTGAAFESYCNIYAPYYRQVNLTKAKEIGNSDLEKFCRSNGPGADVFAALDYYFAHFNNGKPFILVGHSQGSTLLKYVLDTYMKKHPEYQKQMIATYVVGISVTQEWLNENPHLKFAQGERDTGVIISWNTEGPNPTGKNLVVEEGAIAINPINWRRDETPATVTENRGSLLVDMTTWTATPVFGIADATVNLKRGTVVCTTSQDYSNPDVFGNQSFHSHDYDFYFENIKENGRMRIASYFGQLDAYEGAKPYVIAHRGASSDAPENTMPAFQKAAELGVDGIETDVQLTLDKELVISHNYSIDGISNGKGLIREKTLSELKTYDFGSWYSKAFTGVKIATLAEVLEQCKDFKIINIELKAPVERDESYIIKVADTIKASGVMDKVIVSGFDHTLLRDLKNYLPELKVGALTLPNIVGTLAKYDIDIANYIPADKVLTTLKVEDIKPIPKNEANVILNLGITGNTAEAIIYELAQSSGAMFPGANWTTVEEQIKLQSNLTKYVDGLDFKIDFLHPEYNTLLEHPEVVDEMHSRGIGVNVWTPNDAEKLEQLYSIGVDGVITDKPELAKKMLKLNSMCVDVNTEN